MRTVHIALAAFVAAALLLRLGLSIWHPDPAPDNPDLAQRMIRYVSYFTIQSNFAVLLASIAVLKGKPIDEPWWRALRLASLLGITVTGIIYATVLAGGTPLHGLSWVANLMLHYLAPPFAILAWLAAGPWPRFVWSDAARALIWPLLWVAYTLIHGAIANWYPYPFIDVIVKGYGAVTVNIVVITVFAVGLAIGFVLVDGWNRRWRESRAAS